MTSPTHAEVIIIGAGLSGLQAATTLHEAGISFLVLEARDRIGGKTLSRDFSSGVSDMGAAWINSTNQSHMYALAQKFGLEMITQNTDGEIVMHDLDGSVHSFPYGGTPGKEVEVGGVQDMVRIRDLFEETCQKVNVADPLASYKALGVEYDKMSMADFVTFHKGGDTARCTVTIWTRAMLGLEPGEVSALYFLAYCKAGGGLMQMRSDRKDGGQFIRIAKGEMPEFLKCDIRRVSTDLIGIGTQSFSRGLASLLPPDSIALNSAVSSVDSTNSTTTVTTKLGKRYTCQRVIVSLPTTLYKSLDITPPLPPSKQRLAEATIHGHTSKVFLAYSTPWWRKSGFCGLTQSLRGLVAVTRDTSNDSKGHYTLLCFLVGDPGRNWSLLSPANRRKALEDHIGSVFAPLVDEVPKPTGYTEQIWSNEEFSAGCPCPAFPPGLMSEVGAKAIAEGWGRVHFVGTETSQVWRGYMEGAVRSGIRGAEEVIGEFKKAKL
jgi:monoamine oxidase